jgi:hypothetical protein
MVQYYFVGPYFFTIFVKIKKMEVSFSNTFAKSIKRMIMRQTWWYKIYELFTRDIIFFFKNIWFFRKELWSHRSWDYQYSLSIFRRSLEELSEAIELYGYEVEGPRLKKVEKIKRAIKLLNNIRTDYYIEAAEKELGELILVDWEFENSDDNSGTYRLKDNETPKIKEHNKKVFDRAREIEEQEWKELWIILEGQDHAEYVQHYNKLTDDEKRNRDLWDEWFDGSGIRGWWD